MFRSSEMALLEETYRKIDPDGIDNMAFVSSDTKGLSDSRNGVLSKAKIGKTPMDAWV